MFSAYTGKCDRPCHQPGDFLQRDEYRVLEGGEMSASPGFDQVLKEEGPHATGIKLISSSGFSALPQFHSLS